MTTQATTPNACMQSLRERLIRQGSIVPSPSPSPSPSHNLEELHTQVIKALTALDEIRGRLEVDYETGMIRILSGLRNSLSDYDSAPLNEKLRHFWVLRFSLMINNISKFINTILSKEKISQQEDPFTRSGFYSPLKENMKNTP